MPNGLTDRAEFDCILSAWTSSTTTVEKNLGLDQCGAGRPMAASNFDFFLNFDDFSIADLLRG